MSKPRQSPQILVFAITMFFALPTSSHAQVKVLMSGGFSAAYQELLPEFQNTTGIAVSTARGASQGNGPNPLALSFVEGCPPTS
jgi:molybdate transport system substrate-binding protein